jgi:hypothetical protein
MDTRWVLGIFGGDFVNFLHKRRYFAGARQGGETKKGATSAQKTRPGARAGTL